MLYPFLASRYSIFCLFYEFNWPNVFINVILKVFFNGSKPYNVSFMHEGQITFICDEVICENIVGSLFPQTEYNITIRAVNGADENKGIGSPSNLTYSVTFSG